MTEQWKPIPEFEGLYDASNLGRIRSAPGKTTKSARFERRVWKSRIMKPKRETSKCRQDQRVTLWKDGVASDHLVSRLVASTWNGVPPEGMTVNHINGKWDDNRPENLEWVTLGDNIRHGFKTGLFANVMRPVALSRNGITIKFPSMAEAGRTIGRGEKYISNALSKGQNIVSGCDGLQWYVSRLT